MSEASRRVAEDAWKQFEEMRLATPIGSADELWEMEKEPFILGYLTALDDNDTAIARATEDLAARLASSEQEAIDARERCGYQVLRAEKAEAAVEQAHAALKLHGLCSCPIPSLQHEPGCRLGIVLALTSAAGGLADDGCRCRETCWTPEPCPIHGFKGPDTAGGRRE